MLIGSHTHGLWVESVCRQETVETTQN